MGGLRLTAKERILLHLLEFTKYADAVEVPPEMTQEGIAQVAWILVPHVTQYVRPLIREELARERTTHIIGGRRKRKVYDLTDAGRREAIRLRTALRAEPVRVRDSRGVHDETIAEILRSVGGGVSLLDIARRAVQGGVVDLDSLTEKPAAVHVQMLSNAPQVEWFVGRQVELGTVTNPDGPRLFVVRGVAGIGKTTLASKACELLRPSRNLFWHRVRPWDTTKSVLAALGDFLATMGKPGLRDVLMRGDLAQAIQVLQEALRGSRSFLVFDDVHDAAPELRPFFRALKDIVVEVPDVRALILTRRAIPFYDRRDVILQGVVKEIALGGIDPAELATVLSDQPESESLAEACRAVGGHPLFLTLVRASPSPPQPAQIRHDLHEFVQETVYRELGESERQIMKVACLYRVPMPREAFLAAAGVSHDAFLALVDRALISPVGEKGFGVHETIQEFFEAVLTAAEMKELSPFATRALQDQAGEAMKAGDPGSSIDCLSNALRFAPESERGIIHEELADAHDRLGDFPAAQAAYEEALRVTKSPAVTSRIHRKLASALLIRGDLKSASSQIDAALRDVGALTEAEKGRIDLLRSDLASSREEWEEAQEYGEAALRIFQGAKDPRGEAEALLELGNDEIQSPAGDARAAEGHLERALELSEGLGDEIFRAKVHNAMAHLFAYRIGDAQKSGVHLAAIEASPTALQDLHLRRGFLMLKGYYCLELLADMGAAEAYFAEAMALAEKIYDPDTMASSRYALGFVAYFQERFEDAKSLFEQSATDFAALSLEGLAVESLSMVAECCLLLGDLEGFQAVVKSLREPSLVHGVRARFILVKILTGLDDLIRGDANGCRAAFAEALQRSEESGGREWPLLHAVHMFYGVALIALGDPVSGEAHLRQADGFLREHGLAARLALKPKVEQRLVTELARARLRQPR